jgi:hypothetical protein
MTLKRAGVLLTTAELVELRADLGFVPTLWPTPAPLNYSAASQQVSGAGCEYGGFVVRAVTGTVNIYACDALTATVGAAMHTQLAVAVGPYPWLGAGTNAIRENSVGLSFIMTGGGTVTIDPLKA